MKHYTLLYAAPPARHACFAVNVFDFSFEKKGAAKSAQTACFVVNAFSFYFDRKTTAKQKEPGDPFCSLSIKKKNAAEIPP